ncbi:MAG TPA: cellulase N-terminal Ig-like domain-containing protein, partial [Fimbriimonas sp.]
MAELKLNDLDYLEMPGLNVMLAHDFYPEGHQGGVGIIQNGLRIATNGDLRLEPSPGQWSPVPAVGERTFDREHQEILVRMSYPDDSKNRRGFNPIDYPEMSFAYTLKVRAENRSFHIVAELEDPLPKEWAGVVGLNLEFFPGYLFGKTYLMDSQSGIFPRQANGPGTMQSGEYRIQPLAVGRRLTVAPESDRQRITLEAVGSEPLQLIDGRGRHNNGWFVVRTLVEAGADRVEWLVTPHPIDGWMSEPTIQVSQVGYHPDQRKVAVLELDAHDERDEPIVIFRIGDKGMRAARIGSPEVWGRFLRYRYLRYEFTDLVEPGMYVARYAGTESAPFKIDEDVFERHVWQPTLETFL